MVRVRRHHPVRSTDPGGPRSCSHPARGPRPGQPPGEVPGVAGQPTQTTLTNVLVDKLKTALLFAEARSLLKFVPRYWNGPNRRKLL